MNPFVINALESQGTSQDNNGWVDTSSESLQGPTDTVGSIDPGKLVSITAEHNSQPGITTLAFIYEDRPTEKIDIATDQLLPPQGSAIKLESPEETPLNLATYTQHLPPQASMSIDSESSEETPLNLDADLQYLLQVASEIHLPEVLDPSLVTVLSHTNDGLCTYTDEHGHPCQASMHNLGLDAFSRHVLDDHIAKEWRALQNGSLQMKNAQFLKNEQAKKLAEDHLQSCQGYGELIDSSEPSSLVKGPQRRRRKKPCTTQVLGPPHQPTSLRKRLKSHKGSA